MSMLPTISPAPTTRLFPLSDSGNAELFAARYGKCVRFDHKRGRWLLWENGHWSEDKTGRVRQLMKLAARQRQITAFEMLKDPDDEGGNKLRNRHVMFALRSEDRHRIDAALELAKTEPAIADDGEAWDADPMLLGAANGVVDLRIGKLRRELPEDRITKHSPVTYDPNAKCPRFLQFIDEICCGNLDLALFIQKLAGHSLTGKVNEQCLPCCYGHGANGKSTLFEVLTHILGLGQYAANLPFSALELQNRNLNDLVALDGARFVTAIETREGVRLNEQRIKALTGGDPVTAKLLYHNPYTFLPTHKLWLSFNHPPTIVDDSAGMWRRIRLIPFNREFKDESADKNLLEKLKFEDSGILVWLVQGCLQWQAEGLGVPPDVAKATASYQVENDHLGQFIEGCCVVDPEASIPSAELWQRYEQWTDENDEVTLSPRMFGVRMEKKGLKKRQEGPKRTRVWVGLRLSEEGEQVNRSEQDF
jgi:putative DNA primase/helicase